MTSVCVGGRARFLRAVTGGILAAVAAVGLSSTSMASSSMPAAVSQKVVGNAPGLARLWAEEGARLPVIVEFAAPQVPEQATSAADPAAADAARIQANHAVQDKILGALFGGGEGLAAAEAADDKNIKRMDFSPMLGISVTAEELEKLAADPNVVRIHEDKLSPPDLIQSVPLIGMTNAYAAGATGNGYHVAVLDTGARRTHEFLSSRIVAASCYGTTSAPNGSTSYCPGGASSSTDIASANDCDPSTISGCGHGTHVSGTAAGFNTNVQAGEPANGVARDGRIIAINVFSQFTVAACNSFGAGSLSNGCVLTYNTDQIRGMERVYALRNTYQIASINMSLGGGQFFSACDSDARKSIIDLLRAANIATVIAAGNDGFDTSVGAPGCISSAITVASSTKADARSSFSNWGTLIDVVAPGSSILASVVNGSSNTAYGSYSGTSMAAPHVAGVFAALRTVRPAATVSEIEAALESTGLGIASAGTTKPRVRVDLALAALGGVPAPANDNFANRIAIAAPGTVNGSNVGATKESGEPNHFGLTGATTSVWWRYTPGASGQITIDTTGSNFDTVLAVYTGGSVGGLSQVAANDDSVGTTSQVVFAGTGGVQYQIAVAGYNGATGNVTLNVAGGGGVPPATSIVAAVAPVARTAQVGTTVTALAAVINAGAVTATDCSIAKPAGAEPFTLDFRARLPGGALGALNDPIDIAPSAAQSYLMIFTPTGAMEENLQLVFDCTNTSPAPQHLGVNSFLLVGTVGSPPADMLAVAVTPSHDAILRVPVGGGNVMAAATRNIGTTASIQARLSSSPIGGSSPALPLILNLCQTNPATGTCLAPATANPIDFNATAGQMFTFSAFAFHTGTNIPFNPATTRLFLHFYQGSTPVGSAGVAVTTVPASGAGAGIAALME